MKIRRGPVSKRTPIYEYQAQYMAKAMRQLEDRFNREYGDEEGPYYEDCLKFGDVPEYMAFIDATFICGFVCTDYVDPYPLDKIHSRPRDILPTLPLGKLRHYIHTLQRFEKWSDHPLSGALISSIRSGALSIAASRLESDQSIYQEL
jgi:hypothetical protein